VCSENQYSEFYLIVYFELQSYGGCF